MASIGNGARWFETQVERVSIKHCMLFSGVTSRKVSQA
jgi:hypothetical protein